MRNRILIVATMLAALGCQDRDEFGNDATMGPSVAGAVEADSARDYIVVFRSAVPDVGRATDELAAAHGIAVRHRYYEVIKGFSGRIFPQTLDAIRHNPNVEMVEADGIIRADDIQPSPPSWGLDRIDQHPLPLDLSYQYAAAGSGVTAYILDSGIRFDHVEFGGRATSGWDFVDGDADASDCNGHGTHVAGTVGGATTGVAKKVKLVSLRVLNCSGWGSYSGMIAAMDWIATHRTGPAVANMSLGGNVSSTLNNAVSSLVSKGVPVAVSAGNNQTDACTQSPASAGPALTVAASRRDDYRASFSNYGSCVDLFAPGHYIRSSTMDGAATYGTWSGTSMASPHVAGVAALYLSAYPSASSSQVESAIESGATQSLIVDAKAGTPNLLLYALVSGSAPTEPPPADTATRVGNAKVHVGKLTSSARTGRKYWRATVTALVVNEAGTAAAGVTVSAKWGGGIFGSGSCTTDATGRCAITSTNISNSATSVTYTVSSLSGTGFVYDSAANLVSSITITKP